MSDTTTPTLAEQLKEAKKARTVANPEAKKAATAQGKAKEDATAKDKKAAQTAVNKTTSKTASALDWLGSLVTKVSDVIKDAWVHELRRL
mgnify:CR=1 FL=1